MEPGEEAGSVDGDELPTKFKVQQIQLISNLISSKESRIQEFRQPMSSGSIGHKKLKPKGQEHKSFGGGGFCQQVLSIKRRTGQTAGKLS